MGCFGFGVTSRGGLNKGNWEEKLGFEESFEKMTEKVRIWHEIVEQKRFDGSQFGLVFYN